MADIREGQQNQVRDPDTDTCCLSCCCHVLMMMTIAAVVVLLCVTFDGFLWCSESQPDILPISGHFSCYSSFLCQYSLTSMKHSLLLLIGTLNLNNKKTNENERQRDWISDWYEAQYNKKTDCYDEDDADNAAVSCSLLDASTIIYCM